MSWWTTNAPDHDRQAWTDRNSNEDPAVLTAQGKCPMCGDQGLSFTSGTQHGVATCPRCGVGG